MVNTDRRFAQLCSIETAYAGYRFRSRLEARWAIFFDALEIPWLYEEQGYSLNHGRVWYLPDFRLPDYNVFVEIKPDVSVITERDKAAYCALSVESGMEVLVFVGSEVGPKTGAYAFFEQDGQPCYDGPVVWSVCPNCCGPKRTHYGLAKPEQMLCLNCREVTPFDTLRKYDLLRMWPTLVDAYKQARGARFEHGEQGGK